MHYFLYSSSKKHEENEETTFSPLLGGPTRKMAPRFGSGFFTHKMLEEAEAEEEDIEEVPPVQPPNPLESTDTKIPKLEYIKTFLKFAVMGAGANWVYPSALAQEIPYFQRTQPEGLCVATYMNATTNLGLLAVIGYFMIMRFIGPIPHSYAVPTILFFSAFGAYLSASVYSVTINGSSVFLFACCAVGGAVGALSSVVMNPFLTNFQNDYISASRTGGSICILLSALLALIQSPGSVNSSRFTPQTYMFTFAVILTCPIFFYRHIVANGIGLRSGLFMHAVVSTHGLHDELRNIENSIELTNASLAQGQEGSGSDHVKSSSSAATTTATQHQYQDHHPSPLTQRRNITHRQSNVGLDIDDDEILDNPSPNPGAVSRPIGTQKNNSNNYHQHTSMESTISSSNGNGIDQGWSTGSGSGLANSQGQGLVHGLRNSSIHHSITTNSHNNLTTRLLTCWKSMLMTCLPTSLTQQYPWLADALPLCLVVGFVNFNTWGMVTALSPFAFKNVSTDESGGASSLALAYELGAMLLVTGDLSTTQFHLPIHIGLLAFALCTFTLYLAAGDLPLFHHPFAPHLLIASFSCGRFFEAHLVRSFDTRRKSFYSIN